MSNIKISKIIYNKEYALIFLAIFSFLLFDYTSDYSIRVKTTYFIFVSLFFIFYNGNTNNLKTIKVSNIAIILFFLILVLITQNKLLNFETISIDIPSYLVASQNIGINEIPFEKQWESKGPLFIYMYKLLSIISFKNLVVFKVLNDLLLFIISILIYKISLIKSENTIKAVIGTIFFISITSHSWYVSELSEIYCLIFITLQYFLVTKYNLSKKIIITSGVLISLSSLINQATVIFLLAIIFLVYQEKDSKIRSSYYLNVILGFSIPHIFFLLLYSIKGFIDVHIANYITIPFSYVGSSKFDYYEIIVWLRRYFLYNEFLYYSLIFISLSLFMNILGKNSFKNKFLVNNLIYLTLSFSIYVIAAHNYQHHLFYSIAFLAILFSAIDFKNTSIFIYSLVFISMFQIFTTSLPSAVMNLKSIENTVNSYPLNLLAKEIDSLFDSNDYTVLALDHVLLLYYLDKPNTSYIIHPNNNYEKYIVDELIETGLLKTNENSHLSYYIELEPDVIICTPDAAIKGFPTDVDSSFYNCEITDYKKNYSKLDTQKYLDNPNRDYYFDPYAEINVFIKDF